MNNLKTYKNILKEYDEDIALNATILIGINVALTPTNIEMVTHGLYTERLNKLWDSVLWELPEDTRKICKRIAAVHHDYEISHEMDGLGGCVPKTYRELNQVWLS